MNAMTLGGRLPLLDPASLSGAQKQLYDRMLRTFIQWADQNGFQSRAEGGRLIGPFNPLLSSPAIGDAFLTLQDVENANTSLSARARQAVILSVGAVWRSDYERYAHVAVAKQAGFSEAESRAIAAGTLPDSLHEDEKIAARVARQLSATHGIEPALYATAAARFGAHGLVDIILLAGIYHIVCGLLNGFEIPAPEEPAATHAGSRVATLTDVALFPKGTFLENLAVRQDNSVLITALNTKQLLYVAPAEGAGTAEPLLLHTFDQLPTGIVEIEPDVFLVSTSNLYTTHESLLHRLDLRDWRPGLPIDIGTVFRFPETARGLNGSCQLAPGVVLIADCFASLIWRVDFGASGEDVRARVWLQHESMGYFPGKMKPEQPGVNGVRYAESAGFLYYTSTAKKLLMRVPVDAATLEPAGAPELVVAGRMGDDFCIDETAQVIYLATHRQNTIDRVAMDPGDNSGFTQSVAGDPFTEALIGPSSVAWSRIPGEYGRVAYVICDGGTASPPLGGPQPAKLIRVVL